MMSMTYFAFFANIGLMIPFLESYTCLKTMLLTLWKDGQQDMEFSVNREPGLHKVFNILRHIYSSIQTASKRLESMMNEHFRLVHPDSKSLKPKIKRRKLT